jgi:TonB-dependent SusC/RagA subfamily outer membrane receptor
MRTLATALAAILLAVVPAQSQNTGTVTGLVQNATSNQPVPAAQLFIESIELGGLTQQNGRYLLVNVPAGTHTLSVARIGFQTQDVEVTVGAGQTVVQDFRVTEEALRLDEIVVTGTPGGTQRRAIGNAVGRVDAVEVMETQTVAGMEELLRGREPGLMFQRGKTQVGGGAQIRIRGSSSFTLGDTPLLYIDGVRVDNTMAIGVDRQWGGGQASRLDDMNPNDIESIEIIKGPAAATLYGTEASAGVIQIITKKGTTGEPQFDLTMRQGKNWLMDPHGKIGRSYARDSGGNIISFDIWETEQAGAGEFLNTGHLQEYNLGMRGGTDAIRYYMSGDFQDETGMVDYNTDQRYSIRGNISVLPSETVSIDLSTSYLNGASHFLQQRGGQGIWTSALWSNPLALNSARRGFFVAPPEALAEIDASREFTRFTGGLTVTHTPWERFTQRLVVGQDVNNELTELLVPRDPLGASYFFGALSLGELTAAKPTTVTRSFDYSASLNYALLGLDFTTSFGAQYNERTVQSASSIGRVFASPVLRNMAGASLVETTEIETANKTFGVYAQQELNYGGRFFLTGAVRGDDNSAFGANFDAAIYPKLSATWSVSEESFWNFDVINQLRLRSAWGRAGRQPDTYAAVTLYAPMLATESQSGVRPSIMGNPDVGPEVSTELEVGLDIALFNDRVSGEFTYYSQTVTDAIVSTPVAPSVGFPGSQAINIGQLSNSGWEASMQAQVLDRTNLGLRLGVNGGRNRNSIDDLGTMEPTKTLRVGYPFPAYAHKIIRSAEFADPVGGIGGATTNVMCDGGSGLDNRFQSENLVPCASAHEVLVGGYERPTYTATFDGTLTLYQNFRLSAMVETRWGDYWTSDYTVGCRHSCFPNSLSDLERKNPIFAAARQGQFFRAQGSLYTNGYQQGFAKLREVQLSYQLPNSIAEGLRASRASITVGANDLWVIWVKQKFIEGVRIPDPEGTGFDEDSSGSAPPLSSFVLTMRVSF